MEDRSFIELFLKGTKCFYTTATMTIQCAEAIGIALGMSLYK